MDETPRLPTFVQFESASGARGTVRVEIDPALGGTAYVYFPADRDDAPSLAADPADAEAMLQAALDALREARGLGPEAADSP
jgi:hypothetical protein